MIYLVIALVLGYAAWQLVKVVRRSKAGGCASGCSGCASDGHCTIQQSSAQQSAMLVQIETEGSFLKR